MTRPDPWPRKVGRTLLREATEADLDGLLALRNDPRVNAFMLRTHADPGDFRRGWLAVPASETDFRCLAEVAGQVVGSGFLDVLDGMGQPGMPLRTEARIGYLIHPRCWGRGYASAIARGLLEAAFDGLRLRRVTAGCFADNPASARVLEKAGMRREQHGVQDSWHAELGWVDGYTYAMLRPEWVQRQDRAGEAIPG